MIVIDFAKCLGASVEISGVRDRSFGVISGSALKNTIGGAMDEFEVIFGREFIKIIREEAIYENGFFVIGLGFFDESSKTVNDGIWFDVGNDIFNAVNVVFGIVKIGA